MPRLKFRLLTYNIHRAIGVDRRFRLDRIARILRDHDADVVLLQEVDAGAPRSRRLTLASELAEELGYAHHSAGYNVKLSEGRYGNATLSRFPILRQRNIDLTIGRRKRRGCQHSTLAVPAADDAAPLEVFNLHLGLSAQERVQQVQILASSPEVTRLRRKDPCIVGGDFNDWRSLLRPYFVADMEFQCATDHDTRGGPQAIRTYPSISPRGALDRIYFRGPLDAVHVFRCRHRISRLASDHLPVIADFELG